MHIVGVAISLVDTICSPRLPKLRSELKHHNIEDLTDMYVSVRDKTDGVRGCFQSHQNALKMMLAKVEMIEDAYIQCICLGG